MAINKEEYDVFLNVVKKIPHPLFIQEKEKFSYIFVNEEADDLFRKGTEKFIGKFSKDIFKKEIADKMENKNLEIIDKNVNIDFTIDNIETKKGFKSFKITKVPLFDPSLNMKAILSIFIDITQDEVLKELYLKQKKDSDLKTKKIQEISQFTDDFSKEKKEFFKKQRDYDFFFDYLNLGILKINFFKKIKILDVNSSFLKMFGYLEKKEVLEKNFQELFNEKEEIEKIIEKLKQNESVKNIKINMLKKDKTIFLSNLSILPSKDKESYNCIIQKTNLSLNFEKELDRRINAILGLNLLEKYINKVKFIEEIFDLFLDKISKYGAKFEDKLRVLITFDNKNYSNYDHKNIYLGMNFLSSPIVVQKKRRGRIMFSYPKGYNFEYDFDKELLNLFSSKIANIILNIEINQTFQEFKRIMEDTDSFVFLFSKKEDDFKTFFVSDNINKLGYSSDFFYENEFSIDKIIYKEDLDNFKKELEKNKKSKNDEFFQEFRIIKKDNTLIWVSNHILIKRDELGLVTHFQSIFFDIDKRKKMEKENKLLIDLINNSDTFVFLLNKDLTFSFVSDNAYKLGYSKKYFFNEKNPLSKIIEEKDYLLFIEKLKTKEKENKNRFSCELKVKKADGNFIWLTFYVLLNRNDKNEIVNYELIAIDSTENKLLKEKLKESEKKVSEITNNVEDLISISDSNFTCTFVNPAFYKILGFKSEELVGKNIFYLIHPLDLEKVNEKIKKAKKEKISEKIQIRLKHKKGHYLYFEIIGTPIFDEKGNFLKGFFVSRNINEKKELEDENTYLNEIIKNSNIIVFNWDEKSEKLILIFGDLSKYGYNENEFYENKLSFLDLVYELDKEKVKNNIKENKEYTIYYRIISKDNKKYLIKDIKRSIKQQEKQIKQNILIDLENIDNLKQFSIKEDNYNLNSVIHVLFEDIENSKISFISQNISNFGYIANNFINDKKNLLDIIYIEDKDLVKDYRKKINMQKPENYELEYRIITKENKIKYILEIGNKVKDNDQIYFKSILIDITNRKKIEQKTKKLENIVSLSPVIAFIWDNEKRENVKFVSENINQFGFDAEEFLLGKIKYSDIIFKEDLNWVYESVKKIEEQNKDSFSFIYRIVTKNKKIKWVKDYTHIIRDKNNNILWRQGLILDITEEKEKEIENSKLTQMVNKSPFICYSLNLEDKSLEFISKNISEMGYVCEDFLFKKINYLDIIYPEDKEYYLNNLSKSINLKKNFILEYRIFSKDSKVYWVKDYFYILKQIYSDKLTHHSFIIDITEDKNKIDQLKKTFDLINKSSTFIFTVDEENSVLFTSDAILNLGYLKEDFIDALKFTDIIHPEDRIRIRNEFISNLRQNIFNFSQNYRVLSKKMKIYKIIDHVKIIKNQEDENFFSIHIIVLEKED